MGTLFVEYKIMEAFRDSYLEWVRPMRDQYGFMLLEGSGQPGVYVENWNGITLEEGEVWKKRRWDSGDSDWSPLHSFVEGGVPKLHVWHFHKVE